MTDPDGHLSAPYLPKPISDVLLAFPATVRDLMPTPEAVQGADVEPEWEELARDAFYGWQDNLQLLPSVFLVENGCTSEEAWRHVTAILRSYEPKHQDKLAAAAFLLARWYRWARWSSKMHADPVEAGSTHKGGMDGTDQGQERSTAGDNAP